MSETVKFCNIEMPDGPPTARRVVLNLLDVADDGVLGAAEIIAACALFGISGNSARVTLARLSQARLVEAAERGVYRLGPEGRAIAAAIAGWREAEALLVPWDGRWVAAATGGLPRSDRKALRTRHRALSMLGMRELDNGLFVRPDNFVGGVEAVRARLAGLGLEPEAAVFGADGLDAARQARAMALWRADGLADAYRQGVERLEAWTAKAESLSLDTAARESFILGDDAIRRIVFDPMLPAPLADAAGRRGFVDATIRFDALGRRIWARFLAGLGEGSADRADA